MRQDRIFIPGTGLPVHRNGQRSSMILTRKHRRYGRLADKVLQNLYWQDKRETQADSGHPYSMEQLTFEENPYINITEYTQIAMLTMEVLF